MDSISAHCRELDRCNQRGGRMLSVVDLIEAGTLDVEMAAYLGAAIAEGCSFLVGAVPGGAGKTTVMAALLNFLPADVPIVPTDGSRTLGAAMRPGALRTCYVCHEIGSGPYYAYLWGRDARDLFSLPRYGHVVATNLHADTLQQTHDQLCATNGVDEGDFRRCRLMLFLVLAGSGWSRERRTATVWESDGCGPHRMIYQWDPKPDAYERVGDPLIPPERVEAFKSFIERLVRHDARTIQDVRCRVVGFLQSMSDR